MSILYTLLVVWAVVFLGLELKGLLEGKAKDWKFHLMSITWMVSYFYDVAKLIIEKVKQQ